MSEVDTVINQMREKSIFNENIWFNGYLKNKRDILKKEIEYVKLNIDRNSKLLEYGSAPFIFTKTLDSIGYNVVGTDIAPERFNYFEKLNLNIVKVNYDTENLPIKTNSIDHIICNEVFEHLRGNLIKTFQEAHRVLKTDGQIHISTPNLRSAFGIYMFLFKKISGTCALDLYHEWGKIDSIGHMGHVREYTSKEVILFLEKVGFKVVKLIYDGRTNSLGFRSYLLNLIEKIIPCLRPDMKIVLTKK